MLSPPLASNYNKIINTNEIIMLKICRNKVQLKRILFKEMMQLAEFLYNNDLVLVVVAFVVARCSSNGNKKKTLLR